MKVAVDAERKASRGVGVITFYTCHGQKSRFIGDARHPTFNRESL